MLPTFNLMMTKKPSFEPVTGMPEDKQIVNCIPFIRYQLY